MRYSIQLHGVTMPRNVLQPLNITNFTYNRQKLDLILDFENNGISKHLGQIADSMHEWEGSITEHLGLTRADVAAIKEEYPGKLKLQT